MSIDKTTVGGWAMAFGVMLGAGVAALPSVGYENVRVFFGVGAAMLVAFGSVLLGTYATDTSKTITTTQVAKLPQDQPLTPRDLVKPDPEAAIKREPPTPSPSDHVP
jgi:hypothetical protein